MGRRAGAWKVKDDKGARRRLSRAHCALTQPVQWLGAGKLACTLDRELARICNNVI